MKLSSAEEYPKEIVIGEESWTIKMVARIPKCGAKVVGLCDPTKRIIYLKKTETKSMLFRTFVHEVIHAIEFEYEIPISHKHVYQFERAICDVLMMNF